MDCIDWNDGRVSELAGKVRFFEEAVEHLLMFGQVGAHFF